MKDFKLESNPRCPSCQKTLDGAASTSGNTEPPNPGDFSICLYCGTILRYTDEMQVEACDKSDIEVAVEEGIGEKLLRISKLIVKRVQIRQQGANAYWG